MVWLAQASTLRCVSWTLLPLVVLEVVLIGVILWRTLHQIYWSSHPRRIVLHIILLLSCILRLVFWLGMCHSSILAIGLACLWWSNTMVLLCTAAVIFQWSSAATAGHATAQELKKSRRWTALHPLVFLHSIHLVWTTIISIHVIAHGLHIPSDDAYILVKTFRAINILTLAYDGLAAGYVAVQLRKRLMSAAMADNLKKKSVVQMSLLMALLTASVTLEMIIDVPTVISDPWDTWSSLSFESFCIIKFFIPGLLLSVVFLYTMRRVEQRVSTRMIVIPNQSIVEFVECSSPGCVWCAHHRRYHLNQNKWDVTLTTPFSPRTEDSSYHSSTLAKLSHDSWSSDSLEEVPSSSLSRYSHHQSHEGLQAHHIPYQAYQTQRNIPSSIQTREEYEPPSEILERRGASYY